MDYEIMFLYSVLTKKEVLQQSDYKLTITASGSTVLNLTNIKEPSIKNFGVVGVLHEGVSHLG